MLLENLSPLHDEQINIRARSLDALTQTPDLLDHAAIIDYWMDVIFFFATQYDTNDEDAAPWYSPFSTPQPARCRSHFRAFIKTPRFRCATFLRLVFGR
jgi:hypothetical protein